MSRCQRWESVVVGVLGLFLVIAVPCYGGNKDQVIISQKADVVSLDWVGTAIFETGVVTRNIFDRLTFMNSKYEDIPMLAESWTPSRDKLTWTFRLRRDVKFHDGSPFTAADVKFTLDRIKSEQTKSAWKWLVQDWEFRVIDNYTIELKTKEPDAALPSKLGMLDIWPAKVVGTFVNPNFGLHPVGSGPYKFVEWVKDERVVLEANDNYWGEKPKIRRVIFRPIPEDSSRVAALMAGEIDLACNVPPGMWDEVKKGKDTTIVSKMGTMPYIGLNTFKPPFNDVRVRQAVNYAVDVQSIIDNILHGAAERLNGPFLPGTLGYNAAIKPYPHDVAKAKELLAAAGYPNGFSTTLSTDPVGMENGTNFQEVAEAIAYQLKQVGITMNLELNESSVLWPKYQAGKFDMYLYNFIERWDPERFLRTLFHSKARGYYYKNPTVDKLLDEGGNEFDRAKRIKIYNQLHQVLFDDAPWIFLYKQEVGYGVKRSLNMPEPYDGYLNVNQFSWR